MYTTVKINGERYTDYTVALIRAAKMLERKAALVENALDDNYADSLRDDAAALRELRNLIISGENKY